VSDSDIISMHKQFNSNYDSKELDLKLDMLKTQDHRTNTKTVKSIKSIRKKNVKQKEGLKMAINIKNNTSGFKKKKRKISKSRRRSSLTKKKVVNVDSEKVVFAQQSAH
jgi:hypothetical protein